MGGRGVEALKATFELHTFTYVACDAATSIQGVTGGTDQTSGGCSLC